MLRPAGRLLIADFAAHGEESLREDFAHRRLGFADAEIERDLAAAGLAFERRTSVAPAAGEPGKLTVALWLARDPRLIADEISDAQRAFA